MGGGVDRLKGTAILGPAHCTSVHLFVRASLRLSPPPALRLFPFTERSIVGLTRTDDTTLRSCYSASEDRKFLFSYRCSAESRKSTFCSCVFDLHRWRKRRHQCILSEFFHLSSVKKNADKLCWLICVFAKRKMIG